MTPDQQKIIGLKRQIASLKKQLFGRPAKTSKLKPNGLQGRGAAHAGDINQALEYAQVMGYRAGREFRYTHDNYTTRRWIVIESMWGRGQIEVREVL